LTSSQLGSAKSLKQLSALWSPWSVISLHANVLIISGVVPTHELGVHILGEPLDAMWLSAAFLHDGFPSMVDAGNAVLG